MTEISKSPHSYPWAAVHENLSKVWSSEKRLAHNYCYFARFGAISGFRIQYLKIILLCNHRGEEAQFRAGGGLCRGRIIALDFFGYFLYHDKKWH